MKRSTVISALTSLLLLVALGVIWSVRPEPDPSDLSYWAGVAGNEDWSAQAATGDPQAQFLVGLALIRTNLTKFVGRVPILSKVPALGKRFENISYGIDSTIDAEQAKEAYRWIKKSADQGFAPAKEAEKLFIGKVAAPGNAGAADGSQPKHDPSSGR